MFTIPKRPIGRIAAIGLIAATALAATGCGQQVTGQTNASDDEFSYWSSWAEGEPQQKVIQGIIDDFEADTGATVDVRWLGRDYVGVVNNANAVGDGPDLYDNSTDHIADFRSRDGIGDVESVLDLEIPDEGAKVSDVLPSSVIDASSDSDGLGMIPYVTISTAVWYDKATHPEFADAPIETFDDLLTFVADEKAKGETAIAQDGSVNFYNAYWIYWLLMRHGGPGTLAGLGDDAENWNAPEVLAAAQDVQRLVEAQPFQADYMGTTYPAAQNAWAQGDEALNLNGSWLAGEVAATASDGFDPSTFAFPAVDGGSDTVEVGAQGWTIGADTEHSDLAAQFVAFALQKQYQQQYSTDTNSIAAREGVDAPEPLKDLQEQILNATTVNQTYDGAPALHAGWWNDVFLPLSDQLFSGKIDAAAFVEQGSSTTADYISNN